MFVVPLLGAVNTTLGEVADQVKEVSAVVDVYVALMVLDWHTGEGSVKEMTGTGVEVAAVSVMLSMAIEGSLPTPSSLFTQEKPIFTLGLLLAVAGNTRLAADQVPWPEQEAVMADWGMAPRLAQVVPLKYQTLAKSLPTVPR